MITLPFVLLLLAAICFVAAAFNVSARGINLVAAGLALWILSLLIR
jgi:hypothetical protein